MLKSRKNISAAHIALRIVLLLFVVCTMSYCVFYDRINKWKYPLKYQEYVDYYSAKYDVDPYIIYSFIRTESSFNENACSDVDARGLMQITEITFDWIKSKIAPNEQIGFDDMYDPEINVRFGTYFVSYCLLRYQNDLATAAASYHSGWGTVDELLAQSEYSADGKILTKYPYPNMRQYVHKITNTYTQYQKIYEDR